MLDTAVISGEDVCCMLICSMMRFLSFTAGSVSLCDGCSSVVVLGLSVRLSWYHMLWVRLLR